VREQRDREMEVLGLTGHTHEAVHCSHLCRIFGGGHRSHTRVAQAEESGENDGRSAASDANGAATGVAQQLDVVLPIFFPSARKNDPPSPPSFDAAALHRPPRFSYVQARCSGKQRRGI